MITVGAMKPMGTPTRTDDLIASYSSKGPTAIDAVAKPDIVAPGNLLVSLEAPGSTLYNQFPGDRVPYNYYVNGGSTAPSSSYFTLSGTSMATGVVSGAVADLLQKSPRLTPDQVKARLMKTAYKSFPASSSTTDPTTGITYTDQYDVFTVGAGYLDVEAALNSNDVAKGTAMSPIATYNPNSGNVYLSDDSTAVWNTSATWSNSAVWGSYQFVGVDQASNVQAATPSGAAMRSGVERLVGFQRPVGHQRVVGQQRPLGEQCVVGQQCPLGQQRCRRRTINLAEEIERAAMHSRPFCICGMHMWGRPPRPSSSGRRPGCLG